MPLVTGTRLGSYEVIALIGEGGMGQVYRARDAKLGRDVAIKILPPDFLQDPIVDAIYENGTLVLQQPLPLPEHAHVRVTVESDLERAAWLTLSEESLKQVWDNDADDIFNELLQK